MGPPGAGDGAACRGDGRRPLACSALFFRLRLTSRRLLIAGVIGVLLALSWRGWTNAALSRSLPRRQARQEEARPGAAGERAGGAGHHQDGARCLLSNRSGRRHPRMGPASRGLDRLDPRRKRSASMWWTCSFRTSLRDAHRQRRKKTPSDELGTRSAPVRSADDASGRSRIPGRGLRDGASPRRRLRSSTTSCGTSVRSGSPRSN